MTFCTSVRCHKRQTTRGPAVGPPWHTPLRTTTKLTNWNDPNHYFTGLACRFPSLFTFLGALKHDSHITKHVHFSAPNVYKYLIHGSHLLLCVRTPQQEHDILRVIADVLHNGIRQLLPALVLVWISIVRSNRENRIEQQHTWTQTTEPFKTDTAFYTEY